MTTFSMTAVLHSLKNRTGSQTLLRWGCLGHGRTNPARNPPCSRCRNAAAGALVAHRVAHRGAAVCVAQWDARPAFAGRAQQVAAIPLGYDVGVDPARLHLA